MRHMISMTSILKNWLADDRDEIQLSDLEDGMFYFSCSREHLDGIPHEATWCNTELPYAGRGDDLLDEVKCTVHIDQVDKSLHEKLLTFLSLVESADKEGRVKWEVGNHFLIRDKLAAEAAAENLADQIFCSSTWQTIEDIRKENEELANTRNWNLV